MNKNRKRLLISLALVICITAAQAQNMVFMRKSPIAWMNDKDQAILKETIDAVLAAPDGTSTDWLNPDTGSRGKVQVLDTREDYDTTCQHIRMSNQAKGRSGRGVYRLCLATDGSWKFAPNASDAPAYDDKTAPQGAKN